jgi:ABC-type Fe3+/spermidine/putrescine transport system ATPase subunit
LADLDLAAEQGQVLAVLGPSGAGKTTLLHALAGFVSPTAGEIWLAGRKVAWPGGGQPPERRSVGVVFQNYALWPHLRALDIVAYPLRRARVPAREARRQAAEELERLQIAHLADRRPAELSGGEQQRVALARALCRRGSINLFDEPTAHLDAPLRAVVQAEVAEAGRTTGAAVVYATHDSAEALAVADRVAVLRHGRLVQVGSAREVYERPVDVWAARLTGPASVVPATTVHDASAVVAGIEVPVCGAGPAVLLRPDWVALQGPLDAIVKRVHFRGSATDYELDTEVGTVLARVPGPPGLAKGERIGWAPRRGWLVPPPTLDDHAEMVSDTPENPTITA